MANLTETSNFDTGVYQIETTDLVLGGAGAIANAQPQALANRTKYLKDNLYRLASVAVVTANKTMVNTDANILQQLTASGHITIVLPDVTTTAVGDRYPFTSIMPYGKCATLSAADTIKNNDGDARSLMYIYGGERLELISAGTYWLIGDCFGNFESVGVSYGVRKRRGNTLVCDGALVLRADYPRLTEFVTSLTSGQDVVTDANWLGGAGGNINVYRGCFSLGNGSTTLRLPDERGLFDRYLDLTRGLDTGRLHEFAGGLEMDAVIEHYHNTNLNPNANSAAGFGKITTGGDGVEGTFPLFKSQGVVDAAGAAIGATETRSKNMGKIPVINF